MSLPSEPLPENLETAPPPPVLDEAVFAPASELAVPPPAPSFPVWSGWNVLAIAIFTGVAIIIFTLIALLIAKVLPAYRNASFSDLANAKVLIGAQAAAYPIVLLFIYLLVRTKTDEPFDRAVQWNWPGVTAPAYIASGVILALVVSGLARFLPIPKSLPMDSFFHDASSAYMMAVFGITLAPLLEEIFFRGLLFPWLRRFSGVVVSVVLTALGFAAIHGAQLDYSWGPVLSIFFVGVVLTLVRWRATSVAASFLVHCGYNFALFAALWIASDHYRHLEKVTG